MWKGGFREPAIALQSASLPPNTGEFMNKLTMRIQEANREGKASDDKAWIMYTKDGDIDGAIQELNKVLPISSEYTAVQEKLAVWQSGFDNNQQNFNLSQAALNNGKLTAAEGYAKALDSTQDYWKTRQQDLLNRISQERARIERQSHRLICENRNPLLSQFQVDAQGMPILDSSGELVLVKADSLFEGTKVALTRSPASSQMSNLDLSFVEVKEGPDSGKRGWVDSNDLCRLSD